MPNEDFAARYAAVAADPEAVIRLFVEALLALEVDRAIAEQQLCVLIAKNLLSVSRDAPTGLRLPNSDQTMARLGNSPVIARALAGGTPAGSYADFAADKIAVDRAYSAKAQGVDYPAPGKAKFFVACGGADTPRPIALARNNAGHWKVTEWSSLTVGVKPAAGAGGDF